MVKYILFILSCDILLFTLREIFELFWNLLFQKLWQLTFSRKVKKYRSVACRYWFPRWSFYRFRLLRKSNQYTFWILWGGKMLECPICSCRAKQPLTTSILRTQVILVKNVLKVVLSKTFCQRHSALFFFLFCSSSFFNISMCCHLSGNNANNIPKILYNTKRNSKRKWETKKSRKKIKWCWMIVSNSLGFFQNIFFHMFQYFCK